MRYNRPRRNRFRSNDKGFRRNGSQDMGIGGINSASNNFQRRSFSRNGFNAEKLLEKYNNLAKEASSSGDRILSESYYQHADHFLRVIENRNSIKNNSKTLPRQDANRVYDMNASIYIYNRNYLFNGANTLWENNVEIFLMPYSSAFDIDDEIDFQIAELMMKYI